MTKDGQKHAGVSSQARREGLAPEVSLRGRLTFGTELGEGNVVVRKRMVSEGSSSSNV